jgi:uncharacterized protein (UPF0276 family)
MGAMGLQDKSAAVGLGLRRNLTHLLTPELISRLDFMEIAPENWIGVGGRLGRQLRAFRDQVPFFCHGLSLNLGGFLPLDDEFLRSVKAFLDLHDIRVYSEHLSACADDGHLYDLMPISFSSENVLHVAARIRHVQNIIERPLIIENVSAYVTQPGEFTELEFIRHVLAESGCQLLLDVNNVFVNSCNFGFDAAAYVDAIPSECIAYYHMAGHYNDPSGLKIDTHGSAVCADVWQLFQHTVARHGVRPTLLERDFNVPPVAELLQEISQITSIVHCAAAMP